MDLADTRAEPRDRILLRAQVPPTLDVSEEADPDGWGPGVSTAATQLTCRLFVSYSGVDAATNVAINVKVPDAVVARETTFIIPSIRTCARVCVWVDGGPLVRRP